MATQNTSGGSRWVCISCGAKHFRSFAAFMGHRRYCVQAIPLLVDEQGDSSDSEDADAANDIVEDDDEVEDDIIVEVEDVHDIVNDAHFEIVDSDDDVDNEAVDDIHDHNEDEDIALYINDGADMRYRMKFMRWGLAGAGGEDMNGKSSSYNEAQLTTLEFLKTLETGDPLSYARQQSF